MSYSVVFIIFILYFLLSYKHFLKIYYINVTEIYSLYYYIYTLYIYILVYYISKSNIIYLFLKLLIL